MAGLLPPETLLEKVGVVVWQPLQSPEVGWLLSNAVGRESPQAAAVLAIIPRYGAVWWQVWQPLTPPVPPIVVCPATVSAGEVRLAAAIWNPPGFTLVVLWQPEPLQSRLPIGMWLFGLVTIVTLAKGPTVGP